MSDDEDSRRIGALCLKLEEKERELAAAKALLQEAFVKLEHISQGMGDLTRSDFVSAAELAFRIRAAIGSKG